MYLVYYLQYVNQKNDKKVPNFYCKALFTLN